MISDISNVAEFDGGQLNGKIVLLRIEDLRPAAMSLSSLSTLEYLLSAKASIAILSYVDATGRDSQIEENHKFADWLSQIIHIPIAVLDDCRGRVADAVAALKAGEALLLGNLALEAAEPTNMLEFSRLLAGLCDIYCNEAFGISHEVRASTFGVAMLARQSVAGLCFESTLRSLSEILDAPARPFLAIFGGILTTSKLLLMSEIASRADVVLLGGEMCLPFLAAEGRSIGGARTSDNEIAFAARVCAQMRESKRTLLLPEDFVVAQATHIERLRGEARASSEYAVPVRHISTRETVRIEESEMPADIGIRTQLIWSEHFASARTILWHGPLGITEFEPFSKGTIGVAEQLINRTAPPLHRAIVCGQRLVNTLQAPRLDFSRVRLLAPVGMPILYYAAGRPLPAVEALRRAPAEQKRPALVLQLTGTEDDVAIAHFAANWLPEKAAIHCVFVKPGPDERAYPDLYIDVPADEHLAAMLDVERVFARAHGALASRGITPVSEAVLHGSISERLIETAQELGADAIVMRAEDVRLGMTADAPCPLIFLPQVLK